MPSLTEEQRDQCFNQIEKGMKYCGECETSSIDNLVHACIKHKKMYAKIQKVYKS